jgi:hypothetical protein
VPGGRVGSGWGPWVCVAGVGQGGLCVVKSGGELAGGGDQPYPAPHIFWKPLSGLTGGLVGGLTHWWAGSATAHGTGCAGPRHLPALQHYEMYIYCMCVGLRMPWGPDCRLGPGNVCPVLPGNCGLWWAVVGAVGRQGSLLHPLPPLASLCWQTLEDELFEIISPPGREPHGGVGGEEVRLPILDFFWFATASQPRSLYPATFGACTPGPCRP